MEGTILAENSDNLEIQVGQNEAGTIRKVLVIDYSELLSWSADAEGRTLEKGPVHKQEGLAYLEERLRQGEKAVSENDFSRAEKHFRDVIDLAGKTNPAMEAGDLAETLTLRAHGYALLQTTLEGKVEMLEVRIREVEKRTREEQRELEDAWSALKKDQAEEEKRLKAENAVRSIGSKHVRTRLEEREEGLRVKTEQLKMTHERQQTIVAAWKEMVPKLEAESALVGERMKKAEQEAKVAVKAAREK